MVERQRREDDLAPVVGEDRPHPRARLQHVGDDVPVQQHRPLGDARGAARVLQEREVVVRDRDARQRHLAALLYRVDEADGARQRVIGHHLLDVPQHEVDDLALDGEHRADRRHDGLPDARARHDLLQRTREVLDDDDDLGARVDELMLELARRVQRIDVHHRAAGAQRPEQAHRVLEDVGHHEGDARALRATDALQPCTERRRQRVQVGERDRAAHARECGPRRELAASLLEHFAHRRVFVDVDVRGHALRVMLEPDAFHDAPPGSRSQSSGGGLAPDIEVPAFHQPQSAMRRQMLHHAAFDRDQANPHAAGALRAYCSGPPRNGANPAPKIAPASTRSASSTMPSASADFASATSGSTSLRPRSADASAGAACFCGRPFAHA